MLYTVRMKITDDIIRMDCEQRKQGVMGLYLVQTVKRSVQSEREEKAVQDTRRANKLIKYYILVKYRRPLATYKKA